MRNRGWGSLVVLLSLGAFGCQSGFSTGVDSGKPYSELTPAETMSACFSYASYLESQVSLSEQQRLTCTIEALGTTTTPDQCEAQVTACLAGGPDGIFDVDCSGATGTDPDCMATVGQVELCISAETDIIVARFDEISCAIAGNLPELMRLQERPPVPSECSSLATVCPDLADGFAG